ncbi:MAG: TrmH family RNA methyltransferase [Ekhidna sp.]
MVSKNEQKFIKSLKVKKYRTREECFLVEGSKNVLELLNSDFKVDLLIGTEAFFQSNTINDAIRREIVKVDLLEQLSTFKTNTTSLAVVQFKKAVVRPDNSAQFVLDGVGDPGNLGTIIRTLDWFGYDKLICSNDCAEFYHPKVIASTMGSFTRINVEYVDIGQYLAGVSRPVYAADMNGKSIHQTSIANPSVILMGSESNGISSDSKKYVTDYISIPKVGEAESLNVGVATGIIANHLRF